MNKNCVNKYDKSSYIYNLNIEVDTSLGDDQKNAILYDIFNLINEKYITKNISNTDIRIKWSLCDNNNLLDYHTDGGGILSDIGIHEHTKLLLNDIKQIKNSDKFNIRISKSLTRTICIM